MSACRLLLPLAYYRRQLNPLSAQRQRKCVKCRQPESTAYLSLCYLSPAQAPPAYAECLFIMIKICELTRRTDMWAKKWMNVAEGDPFLTPPPTSFLTPPPTFPCFPEMGVNSMAVESICSLGPVCGSIAFYVIWSLLYISGGQYRHRNKVKRDLIDSFSVCGGETITHLGMAGILNRWVLNIWKESPIGFKAVPDLSTRVRWLIAFLVFCCPRYLCMFWYGRSEGQFRARPSRSLFRTQEVRWYICRLP